jgi:gamma-glutamyltranspeptidase/glutathione hydrolase
MVVYWKPPTSERRGRRKQEDPSVFLASSANPWRSLRTLAPWPPPPCWPAAPAACATRHPRLRRDARRRLRLDRQAWLGNAKFAVAAANPLATDAGYQVLKAGGSAVDAAIAVQMVLTLVEPQSSGIGGGAFLLHCRRPRRDGLGRPRDGAGRRRRRCSSAPTASPCLPRGVVGGRSVGVPGAVRMLEQAHRQHGRLPWAQLFQPAIALAEQRLSVSPRLNTLLKNDEHLKKDPVAAAYFYDAAGNPHPVGHVLKNPELAEVLRGIAARGSAALLEGPVAQAIVDKVRKPRHQPGAS